jgi:Spy/CpxP family protein refolding chaperone
MHYRMHPAVLFHLKQMREAMGCGDHAADSAACGTGHHGCGDHAHGPDSEGAHASEELPAQIFGVRRPLRYMAHKLDLDDAQVQQLARILNDLKTERAQAAVFHQRTVSAFADALTSAEFDEAKATEGLDLRIEAAQRLREAVRKALRDTHAMLSPEQRERLAFLLRSGALTI